MFAARKDARLKQPANFVLKFYVYSSKKKYFKCFQKKGFEKNVSQNTDITKKSNTNTNIINNTNLLCLSSMYAMMMRASTCIGKEFLHRVSFTKTGSNLRKFLISSDHRVQTNKREERNTRIKTLQKKSKIETSILCVLRRVGTLSL